MSKWQALNNISVPQKGPDKQTDLVFKGETVEMRDDDAEAINRRHRVPVLRKASEAKEPLPVITGRMLYNDRPRADTFAVGGVPARPDPEGSSQLIVQQSEVLERVGALAGSRVSHTPESNEPSPGSQERLSDAIDLPPRGGPPQRRRG
jgi:hypothetical protein